MGSKMVVGSKSQLKEGLDQITLSFRRNYGDPFIAFKYLETDGWFWLFYLKKA